MELRAPAKINLYLEVLGERDNGYHDIQSVVLPVSLGDVLWLEPTEGEVSLVLLSSDVPGGDVLAGIDTSENLACRAARVLRRETGCSGGVRIELRKHVPVGGGLGGGSADAAAVLRGLNEMWDCGLSIPELAQLGSSIGCDVPALIIGGAVRVGGLGEQVSSIPVQPWANSRGGSDGGWLLLVNPGFGVSTADIFRRYRTPLTSGQIPFNSMVSALEEGDLSCISSGLFNGLQETIFRKYPLIEMVVEGLVKAGASGALVSGSGASVFGLAESREHAAQIETGLRGSLGVPLWCKAVQILPDGVMVAHGPLEARV